MRRSISVLIAAAVASSTVSFTPASAMPAAPKATSNNGPAVQLVRDRADGGRGGHWRRGHRRGGHWGGGHRGYGHRGYGHYGSGYGFGLGAFGFGTGLLLGSQLGYYGGGYYGSPYYGNGYYGNGYSGGGYDDYDVACAQRYRSYDPYSNTFLGYDGYRHPCRLY
jgi:hypothetical protein